MGKSVFSLATLILSTALAITSSGQYRSSSVTNPCVAARQMRPVKEKIISPVEIEAAAREFDFLNFNFKEIYYGYEGPNYTNAAGEPIRGAQLVAEARLFMTPAITTVRFDLLDESGRAIQTLYFVKADTDVSSGDFVGVVSVPAQPFRAAVSGLDITGKTYHRVYNRLFRPTNGPQDAPRLPSGLPPDKAKLYYQALIEHDRQVKARLVEEGKANTGGVITLPQIEVSEVAYEPLLSAQGNPIGIRLRYSVRVSSDGYYRFHPSVLPLYASDELRGKIRMEALGGMVSPLPAETGTDDPSDLLRYGGGGKFKAGQVYHFTAELIPDFALKDAAGARFCITRSKFKGTRAAEAAWRTLLENNASFTYEVYIGGTNFTGRIENFHAPGIFHRSFLKEGAIECDEHGNTNL